MTTQRGQPRNVDPSPLCRKEGWSRWAEAPPPQKPQVLTMSELKSLGSEELFEYNERRRYWHANIGPLATLQMIDAHESRWEIVDSNRQDTGHARGAVAHGAGLGQQPAGRDHAAGRRPVRRAGGQPCVLCGRGHLA